MTDYDELFDNLQHIYDMDNGEEFLYTLKILSNLMIELGNHRSTSARYHREFKHGKLIIKADFGEQNAGVK